MTVTTRTNERGAFRLACAAHTTLYVAEPDPFGRSFARFEPALPPTEAGTELLIREPRLSANGDFEGLVGVLVHGTVRRQGSATPLPNASISLNSVHVDASGTLVLALGLFAWSDAEGRYSVLVQRGPRVRAYVSDRNDRERTVGRRVLAPTGRALARARPVDPPEPPRISFRDPTAANLSSVGRCVP